MLADPRRLERQSADGLWVTLIDPVKALSARSYESEGSITIEVKNEFSPDAFGIFKIDTSSEGASCTRVPTKPDISVSASVLGAAYLGGLRTSSAARAGRIAEHRDGALQTFDRLFATTQAPWCPHEF